MRDRLTPIQYPWDVLFSLSAGNENRMRYRTNAVLGLNERGNEKLPTVQSDQPGRERWTRHGWWQHLTIHECARSATDGIYVADSARWLVCLCDRSPGTAPQAL